MTFRQLAQQIALMPEVRKDDNVSVYLEANDEFYGIFSDHLAVAGEANRGVLDEGHRYLVVSDI